MANYSSDEDPALTGDFTMDTDFDFELPVRCQGPSTPRNVYNLTGLAAGESKKRGKGEGGRGGVGGQAKPPTKEKVQRPPLDIHTAALVGEPVGSSPSTGGDGKILCRICGDSAVRHVHYGGHCCFSCKAFFRRAVNWQNKNNRNFQCKFESKCEITIKNRKTCQSCRFKKCMTTGMNPSWVLSDEQRKKRFKKYRDGGEGGETTELSPASSQDSERDSGMLGTDRRLTEVDAEYLELGATRRRAKSAPVPADVGLASSNVALQRLISQPGPSPPPPRQASRLPRLSGPPGLPMSMPVPVIKVEKDQFEMSPLPPDFAIDFNDTHKHFGATEPNIKVEQDLDFDQADFDSLEGLIQNYELTHQATVGPNSLQNQQGHEDVKPDINRNKKDFTNTAPTSIPTGICLQLSEEDMMSIYKLEMSFENSFASIPLMGAETNEIWDFISQSWNFRKVSHSFTSSLLTEAVELCLRRNLIFLQENSDFASLSIKDRKVLYNNNMGSMCHVRGVMQHTTKHDFLVRSSTPETRVQGRGVISYPNQAQSDIFEISYKNHKTGKIRRWNLMESPFQEFPNGSYNQPGDVDSEVYNTHERERRQSNSDCQKKSLLHLAESLWALDLERTSYLILLLIVLFSTQGCQIENLKEVDRCQNQYMMLLFRYLQAKHGQEKVHGYLSKIMTFVLNLLTNSY